MLIFPMVLPVVIIRLFTTRINHFIVDVFRVKTFLITSWQLTFIDQAIDDLINHFVNLVMLALSTSMS